MRYTCIFTMIASLIIMLIFAFGLLDGLGTLVALGTGAVGIFLGMVVSIYADIAGEEKNDYEKE